MATGATAGVAMATATARVITTAIPVARTIALIAATIRAPTAAVASTGTDLAPPIGPTAATGTRADTAPAIIRAIVPGHPLTRRGGMVSARVAGPRGTTCRGTITDRRITSTTGRTGWHPRRMAIT